MAMMRPEHNIHFLFLFALHLLCNQPCLAIDDVKLISIHVSTSSLYFGTFNTVNFALWFNFTIYQFSLSAPEPGTTYIMYKESQPQFTVLGPSNCHKPAYNNIPEAKLMIENDDMYGFLTNNVSFTTTSGDYYGITSICVSTNDFYQPDLQTTDSVSCGNNMYQYSHICVDDQPYVDCGPPKQMVYFDTTQPNVYINNAAWSDATFVIPEITSCDPTYAPSNHPSNDPSVSPTDVPSSNPSYKPTPLVIPPVLLPTHAPINSIKTSVFDVSTSPIVDRFIPTSIYEPKMGNKDAIQLYVLVGMIAIAVLALCVCICACYYKSTSPKKRDEVSAPHAISDPVYVTPSPPKRTMPMEAPPLQRVESVSLEPHKEAKDTKDKENKKQYEEALVAWFENALELPQYLDIFVENGYDKMKRVGLITNKAQLREIGITMAGHQTLILSEIDKVLKSLEKMKRKQNQSLPDLPLEPRSYIENIMDNENEKGMKDEDDAVRVMVADGICEEQSEQTTSSETGTTDDGSLMGSNDDDKDGDIGKNNVQKD